MIFGGIIRAIAALENALAAWKRKDHAAASAWLVENVERQRGNPLEMGFREECRPGSGDCYAAGSRFPPFAAACTAGPHVL